MNGGRGGQNGDGAGHVGWAMRRTLALILSEMEPQEGSGQGGDVRSSWLHVGKTVGSRGVQGDQRGGC